MATKTKNAKTAAAKAPAKKERKEPVTLTKLQLIAQVAERTGVDKKDVEKALNAEYGIIAEFLGENKDAADGARVQIMGHGTYKTSFVKGRMGRNPQEPGEEMEIPDGFRVHFSAGQGLKDVINGKDEAPAKAAPKNAAAKGKKKKK